MICPLTLTQCGSPLNCYTDGCVFWDNKKDCCLLKTALVQYCYNAHLPQRVAILKDPAWESEH